MKSKVLNLPVLYSILTILSIVIAGARLSDFVQRDKPTLTAQEERDRITVKSLTEYDKDFPKLLEAIKANPKDVDSRVRLANLMVQAGQSEIREIINPSDIAKLYREALDLEPDNKVALLGLADLLFSIRFVEGAKDLYKKYLELNPKDDRVRATYASCLTLLKDFEGAERELNQVIKNDPKQFNALANLAINYIERGDMKLGQEVALRALEAAPHEEAKNRLQNFFDKTIYTKKNLPRPEGVVIDDIINLVKDNPVAGPKFVKYSAKGEFLNVYMKDFPFSAMPPFARDKFLSPIREALKLTNFKDMVFFDADTKQEIGRANT